MAQVELITSEALSSKPLLWSSTESTRHRGSVSELDEAGGSQEGVSHRAVRGEGGDSDRPFGGNHAWKKTLKEPKILKSANETCRPLTQLQAR